MGESGRISMCLVRVTIRRDVEPLSLRSLYLDTRDVLCTPHSEPLMSQVKASG
jgi:hypothetical protein